MLRRLFCMKTIFLKTAVLSPLSRITRPYSSDTSLKYNMDFVYRTRFLLEELQNLPLTLCYLTMWLFAFGSS